jgi:hypothetical protein
MKRRPSLFSLLGVGLSLVCAGPFGSSRCGGASPGTGGEDAPPWLSLELPALPATWVATAVGRGLARDFESRLEAIHQLGCHLAASDIAVLYRYLLDPAYEPWLQPGQSYALKNDILNALRAQSLPPPELTHLLVALYRSTGQPVVMRDYALQHIAPWYARAGAGERAELVATLEAASREHAQGYAGTALIALVRVQNENATACVGSLTNRILEILRDDAASLCARITAVQLCGLLNLTTTLVDLRGLAAGPRRPPTLRLAAMASLRTVGPTAGPPPVQPRPGPDVSEAIPLHGGAEAVTAALAAAPPGAAISDRSAPIQRKTL